MVGVKGFEPPTPWSQTKCATKLRYTPSGTINRAYLIYNREHDFVNGF